MIDGNALAKDVLAQVKTEIEQSPQLSPPRLIVVLVGDNAASLSYIAKKEQAAKDCGIVAETRRLPATATHSEVLTAVKELNDDEQVHGIIVQLPLPPHIDAAEVRHSLIADW